ncbi:MAG: hypothetical protein WCL04_10975, partial [Verrucomicrobiota bacterium]
IDPTLAAEIHVVAAKVEARLKEQGYTGVSHLVEFFANAPKLAPAAIHPRATSPVPTGGVNH